MNNLFKFISIYTVFIGFISLIIFFYISVTADKQKQLASTKNEIDGIIYLKEIYNLSIQTALYQGDLSFEDDKKILAKSKENLTKSINNIFQLQKKFPEFINNEFDKKLFELKSFHNDSNKFYEFLDYVNHENYRIGDVSKLLFEKDRKAYFLSSLITHYMPEYLISTLNSHNIIEEEVRKGHISNIKKEIFIEQNKLIYLSSKELSGIIKLLNQYNDTKILDTLIREIITKLNILNNDKYSIDNMKLYPETAKKYLDVTHEILELSYKLNDNNINIFELTLKDRKVALEESLLSYKIATISIILLISLILFYFYRSLSLNIKKDLEIKDMHNTLDKFVIFSKTDKNGKVIYVSSALEDLCGYSSDELLGTKFELLRSNEMDRSIFKGLWSTILANKRWTGEIQNRSKDGSYYWLRATITPEVDKKGEISGFSSYAIDITHLKELEVEKLKTQKALEFKSQFLSNMSHEIRTPLNGIIGLIYVVLKTDLNKKQKDLLSKVQYSSNNLLNIINDILDISKIESGKMNIEIAPFDLKELLDNLIDLLSHESKCKDITLNIDYKKMTNINYLGDSLRITQILTNLISNAIKFTKEGGVSIYVENKADNIVLFKVTDTGIGLKEEQIGMLFQEFTQADMSTSRQYGGTGLGLSIVKNLVELMNGRVWINSVYGEGSTFSFIIKLKKDTNTQNIINKKDRSESIKKSIDELENIKILVAEDNKMNQMLLSMLLEDTKIELDYAEDGIIAVDMFKQKKYDLVFMDIQMPNMNGYEATKLIRKIDTKIPIIAISANVMKEDVKKSLASGMNSHLGKPINIDKLYESLFKYLL